MLQSLTAISMILPVVTMLLNEETRAKTVGSLATIGGAIANKLLGKEIYQTGKTAEQATLKMMGFNASIAWITVAVAAAGIVI